MEIACVILALLQYAVCGLLIYIWRHELNASKMLGLLLWVFLTQYSIFKVSKLGESEAFKPKYISILKR